MKVKQTDDWREVRQWREPTNGIPGGATMAEFECVLDQAPDADWLARFVNAPQDVGRPPRVFKFSGDHVTFKATLDPYPDEPDNRKRAFVKYLDRANKEG